MSTLLPAVLASLTALSSVQSDTVDAVSKSRAELGEYYSRDYGRFSSREEGERVLGWICEADQGQECRGRDGDWDRAECPADVGCRPADPPVFTELYATARAHPGSGFLMGQAIYALTKFDRHLEALQLVEECAAAEWWCSALTGLVFQTAGRPDQAEQPFGRFLDAAPDICPLRPVGRDVAARKLFIARCDEAAAGLYPRVQGLRLRDPARVVGHDLLAGRSAVCGRRERSPQRVSRTGAAISHVA